MGVGRKKLKFCCNHCPAVFDQPKQLAEHWESEHRKVEPNAVLGIRGIGLLVKMRHPKPERVRRGHYQLDDSVAKGADSQQATIRKEETGMAERVVVKSISIKMGENDKGPWVNTRVTGEDGQKFSGFDKSLQYLKEGDVFEITEIEIKGQNKNIIKWHKIEGAGTIKESGNGARPVVKTAEQADADRRSAEAIAAFNGIIELAKLGKVGEDRLNVALDWAQSRLKPAAMKKPEAAQPAPKQTEASGDKQAEETTGSGFQNAGQFLTKCKEVFGLNRTQVLDYPEVKTLFDASDFNKAYSKLAETVAKKQ